MPPKSKLTPAQRKAKREERLRQQAEKQKQAKRNHLDREIKYGQLTLKQNEKDWRALLMKISLPQMKYELLFAQHNFERLIDCKDFTISLLMDELQQSEDQYMMNLRNHCENIDKLIKFFRDRLEELRKENESDIDEMMKRNEKEIEEINDSSGDFEEFIKTMLFALDYAKNQQERQIRVEYFSRINEEKSKISDFMDQLRAMLESNYKKLETKTLDFIANYEKTMKQRKKEHKEKREQDELMQKLLKEQLSKTVDLDETIRRLKDQLKEKKALLELQLTDCLNERKYFGDAFITLKKTLEDDRKVDFEKLSHTSKFTLLVCDKLENLIKKGEQILTIGSICRKYETLEEKILPFPLPVGDEEITDCNGLDLFWQRMGQVNASKYAIAEQKAKLLEENCMLKIKLNKYVSKVELDDIITTIAQNDEKEIEIIDLTKVADEKAKKKTNLPFIQTTDIGQEMKKYQKYYSDILDEFFE